VPQEAAHPAWVRTADVAQCPIRGVCRSVEIDKGAMTGSKKGPLSGVRQSAKTFALRRKLGDSFERFHGLDRRHFLGHRLSLSMVARNSEALESQANCPCQTASGIPLPYSIPSNAMHCLALMRDQALRLAVAPPGALRSNPGNVWTRNLTLTAHRHREPQVKSPNVRLGAQAKLPK
jgi:hypothetical protein